MGTLAVVFIQPAFRDFPCFIQRSEQVKIQYLCPVRPVEPFDKRILRRLTRLDKFQCHNMLFSPLRKCQRDQFRAVVHPQFQRIPPVRHYPVQHSDHPLRRDIQINFYCEGFAVKVIHHIEGPETPAADQRIMHKVYRPALVKCLRPHQWRRVTYRQTLLPLAAKIQFQQAINPVNAFMIPGVTLPAQQLEQLLKTVSRVALCQLSQQLDHRLIAPGIGLVNIDRPAQR